MNKICTDINQCKKFIELGIDINTADLTVLDLPIQNGDRFKFIQNKLPGDIFPSITDGKSEKIPAWSLSRLMEFIPKCIVSTPNPLSTNYCCRNVEFDMEFYADNAVDAAYEMVVWLKENEKLYEKK